MELGQLVEKYQENQKKFSSKIIKKISRETSSRSLFVFFKSLKGGKG